MSEENQAPAELPWYRKALTFAMHPIISTTAALGKGTKLGNNAEGFLNAENKVIDKVSGTASNVVQRQLSSEVRLIQRNEADGTSNVSYQTVDNNGKDIAHQPPVRIDPSLGTTIEDILKNKDAVQKKLGVTITSEDKGTAHAFVDFIKEHRGTSMLLGAGIMLATTVLTKLHADKAVGYLIGAFYGDMKITPMITSMVTKVGGYGVGTAMIAAGGASFLGKYNPLEKLANMIDGEVTNTNEIINVPPAVPKVEKEAKPQVDQMTSRGAEDIKTAAAALNGTTMTEVGDEKLSAALPKEAKVETPAKQTGAKQAAVAI